jgi:hypothetical protein
MKLKLNQDIVTEEFFEDCHLIGIVAPIKEYSFIWHINQKLGLNMRLNNSNEIQLLKKKRKYFFSIFEYKFTQVKLEYYVYCNKYDGEYLLPEFKNLDYLWLTRDDNINEESTKNLIQAIRQLPNVQMVNSLSHVNLKNREYLIF